MCFNWLLRIWRSILPTAPFHVSEFRILCIGSCWLRLVLHLVFETSRHLKSICFEFWYCFLACPWRIQGSSAPASQELGLKMCTTTPGLGPVSYLSTVPFEFWASTFPSSLKLDCCVCAVGLWIAPAQEHICSLAVKNQETLSTLCPADWAARVSTSNFVENNKKKKYQRKSNNMQ